MNVSDDFLLWLILGCEIGFWVALFSGLFARYLFKWRRVGGVLLTCVPLIDLILLGASIIDLKNGATATLAHGLAAAYIGFTVAFGSVTIRWADRWFAYKFANAEPPPKPPTHGWCLLVYELKLWGRCLLAVAVMFLLLAVAIALVNQAERTEELNIWYNIGLGTLIFWFIFGPQSLIGKNLRVSS